MSETHHDEFHVPWGALAGAAFLICTAIALASLARLTGHGATRLSLAPAVETRVLHFTDLADGGVAVTDAVSKAQVAVLRAGHEGFVRVVLRGLAQNRSASGLGDGAPFLLKRLQDGSAVLEDPATGRVVLLNAFGANNLAAFTQLLDKPSAQP